MENRAHPVGLGPREFTFHDMRAKVGSDAASAESDLAAQELLHHAAPKITKRVYRRKVPSSIPPALNGEGPERDLKRRVCQRIGLLSKPMKNELRFLSVTR